MSRWQSVALLQRCLASPCSRRAAARRDPRRERCGPRPAAEGQVVRRPIRPARRVSTAAVGLLLLVGSACMGGVEPPRTQAITAVELSANSYWSAGHWWRVIYRDDRSCEWVGNVETERKGNFVGVLDAAQWERVVWCIESFGVEQLPESIGGPDHDGRHLVLTVHRGADSKVVDEYESTGPPAMRTAEATLLNVAREVAWQERPQ